MMMEKCVIATNIRGCREEVVNNKTGYLIELKSSNAIYEKIIQCYKNINLTKKMGQEGRKIALSNYDEVKITNYQCELINKFYKNDL